MFDHRTMSDHHKEHKQQLPIDADGVCMMCGEHPAEEDKLICTSCASPWHPYCVANPPETLSLVTTWECPDCSASFVSVNPSNAVASSSSNDSIVAKMREIEVDETLTVKEKARKRQELMMAGYSSSKLLISTTGDDDDDEVDDYFKCCCCMHLLVKPISV